MKLEEKARKRRKAVLLAAGRYDADLVGEDDDDSPKPVFVIPSPRRKDKE